MSDDLHKFVFLGAMIAIAVFSNRGSLYKERILVADVKSFVQKSPPLFVMDSPPHQFGVGVFPQKEQVAKTEVPKAIVVVENPVVPQKPIPSSTSFSGEPRAVVSENAPADSVGETASGPVLQAPPPDDSQSSFKKIGSNDPPKIAAEIILVADFKSGDEFFSLGKEKRWPIASITKLMSAAIVSKSLAFNQSTTLTEADFSSGSSDKKMKIGDRYSVYDLMSAMLMESSNESAEAMANIYGREGFLSAMNSQASSWGMDTHFSDPTGLSPSNQSTVSDLRKLAWSVYEGYPDIVRTTRKLSASITELNSGKKVSLKNINLLASRPDFLGGKTGYIDEAGGNLLSIFSYNRRPVVIIVLGSSDRFGDTEKLLNWFEKNYK